MLSSAPAATGRLRVGREAAQLAPTKVCATCKVLKSLDAFPLHRGSNDGYRIHCRDCLISGRYQPKPETPAQRRLRAKRQGSSAWQQSHAQALRRYGTRNPLQAAAMRALHEAVNAGRVHRAERCQVAGCRSRKAIEGHHWSYLPEHRLDVLWCCAAHHRQGHARGFITPARGIPARYGWIPGIADAPQPQESEIEMTSVPSFGCYSKGLGEEKVWFFQCPQCSTPRQPAFHEHQPTHEIVQAACTNSASPYLASGYRLFLLPGDSDLEGRV